jgi:transposase
VQTALGPAKLISGGRYSVDFVVHSAADKFDGHLPLNRQARRMRGRGLNVTSQTLWDQSLALAGCFRDAMRRLHEHLLGKELLLADESRWPLLGVKGRKTKNWFAWTLASDNAILHKILDSRSNESGAELLVNFGGVLVTDGYGVYTSLAKKLGYTHANCWSHTRRYFIDAEASAPDEAKEFLDAIGELFGIEREIAERTKGLEPVSASELRAQVRDEKSRSVLNRIGMRAEEMKVLPGTPIASAIKYMANRWDGLVCFVDDPRVPMTSNAAERALRGLVLGRVNHFGSRSKRGTEVAAIFYSLIESAKLNDLDPAAYLRLGALAHLAGEPVLLPHEVKAKNLL